MSTSQPITINGQRIGKMRASWMLFKETWRFLKADKELLALPVLSLVLNLVLFGILVAAFILVYGTSGLAFTEEGALSITQYAFIFGCYVVGAFSLALGQASVAHTVFTRAHGQDATLGQSLKVAFAHWQSLFIWSLITSTVGIILRVISDRSQIVGKIVAALLGAAWSVLTYFVVPAMVIDKKDAFSSMKTSGEVFRRTWGEMLISNISLTLIFVIMHVLGLLAVVGLSIYGTMINATPLIVIGIILYLVWFIGVVLVSSVMGSILKTLLYIYASETSRPTNFNEELLSQMLVRSTSAPAVQPNSIV